MKQKVEMQKRRPQRMDKCYFLGEMIANVKFDILSHFQRYFQKHGKMPKVIFFPNMIGRGRNVALQGHLVFIHAICYKYLHHIDSQWAEV